MIRTAITLIALAGIAAPALAQETQASAAAKFKQEFAASDTNKDGVLNLAEVQSRTAGMRTGAGHLDREHANRLAGLWFGRADANKDGKVTRAEAQALLTATFKRYDANGDGKIGTGERATAKKRVLNEPGR